MSTNLPQAMLEKFISSSTTTTSTTPSWIQNETFSSIEFSSTVLSEQIMKLTQATGDNPIIGTTIVDLTFNNCTFENCKFNLDVSFRLLFRNCKFNNCDLQNSIPNYCCINLNKYEPDYLFNCKFGGSRATIHRINLRSCQLEADCVDISDLKVSLNADSEFVINSEKCKLNCTNVSIVKVWGKQGSKRDGLMKAVQLARKYHMKMIYCDHCFTIFNNLTSSSSERCCSKQCIVKVQ